MKIRSLSLGLLAATQLATASMNATAQESSGGPLDIANFSTTLWGTTDYVFRGISNSDGPAIQGSVDWTYSGFYLGVWGSNTEFSDSDIEIDYYGGYRWSWAGLSFDIAGLYYSYPGEDGTATEGLDPGVPWDPEANYLEGQIIVSKSFEAPWAPSVALKYDYSPDFFGSDGDGHAVQGDVGVTVPMGFLGDVGVSATVGYQDVEGDESSSSSSVVALGGAPLFEFDGVTPLEGVDYVWWRVGVAKTIAGFKFDGSYYATDMSDDLKGFFGFVPPRDSAEPEFRDLIESRIVLTVSRSFTFP